MVGWYRSCRNADLRHPAAVPPGMENGREPCGGSDDDLCGNVRRAVPDLSHGSCLARLLHPSLSQYERTCLGELQLPAPLGRICDLYLFYGIIVILVYRTV